MDISLSVAALGLASSILAEFVKIPFVAKSDITKSLIAIIVTAIVAFVTNNSVWSWGYFVSIMVFALLNYKLIVQPVASSKLFSK